MMHAGVCVLNLCAADLRRCYQSSEDVYVALVRYLTTRQHIRRLHMFQHDFESTSKTRVSLTQRALPSQYAKVLIV
jgi:hypothetical protein